MRRIRLLQLGVGRVGAELIRLVVQGRERLRATGGVDIGYAGLLRRGRFRKGDLEAVGIPEHDWEERDDSLGVLGELAGEEGLVLVDCSAAETGELLLAALDAGVPVATANKVPLTGPQGRFDRMMAACRKTGARLGYECTVGAALPVLRTLRGMRATGDEMLEIQGSLSGTLGYVMTGLSRGEPLAGVVREARSAGYTEPDPRDDLDGMDVARKALILSRSVGWPAELSDVELEPLVPVGDRSAGVEEFLEELEGRRGPSGGAGDGVPRYVARVGPEELSVGPRSMPGGSVWSALSGTDNLIMIRTRRYDERPLVIQGAGAGPELTAAGVLEDVLEVSR